MGGEARMAIDIFRKYLGEEEISSEEYCLLTDLIGKDKHSQQELCEWVINNDLVDHEVYLFLILLMEIYEDEETEGYVLEFKCLNEWLLGKMFSKDFYDYSICYKFTYLLLKINGNDYEGVYARIVGRTDEANAMTVKIAMCSTYGYTRNFFQYKKKTIEFISKIILCINKSDNSEQVFKDFETFMVGGLIEIGYENEIKEILNAR